MNAQTQDPQSLGYVLREESRIRRLALAGVITIAGTPREPCVPDGHCFFTFPPHRGRVAIDLQGVTWECFVTLWPWDPYDNENRMCLIKFKPERVSGHTIVFDSGGKTPFAGAIQYALEWVNINEPGPDNSPPTPELWKTAKAKDLVHLLTQIWGPALTTQYLLSEHFGALWDILPEPPLSKPSKPDVHALLVPQASGDHFLRRHAALQKDYLSSNRPRNPCHWCGGICRTNLHFETMMQGVDILKRMRGEQAVPPITALAGLKKSGSPLLVPFASPDTNNALIVGESGAGKTNLCQTFALTLAQANAPEQLKLMFIGTSFAHEEAFEALGELPQVKTAKAAYPDLCAHDPLDPDILEELVNLTEKRLAEGTSDHLFIFFDDLDRYLAVNPSDELLHTINILLRNGDAAKLHLIACMQDPALPVMEKILAARWKVRIVGKLPVGDDIRRLVYGRELPWSIKNQKMREQGDFNVACADGSIVGLHAAYASPGEIAQTVAEIVEKR